LFRPEIDVEDFGGGSPLDTNIGRGDDAGEGLAREHNLINWKNRGFNDERKSHTFGIGLQAESLTYYGVMRLDKCSRRDRTH